jgi:hypothetical protein
VKKQNRIHKWWTAASEKSILKELISWIVLEAITI